MAISDVPDFVDFKTAKIAGDFPYGRMDTDNLAPIALAWVGHATPHTLNLAPPGRWGFLLAPGR